MCEHHLLPFSGVAHVAFIPNGRVTVLSKLGRVVEEVARQRPVQERLTQEIADLIGTELDSKEVTIIIRVEHSRMSIRGVGKRGRTTVTSAVRGLFKSNPASRTLLMSVVRG